MQTIRGTIKANIGWNDFLRGGVIQPLNIGALVNVATLVKALDEV